MSYLNNSLLWQTPASLAVDMLNRVWGAASPHLHRHSRRLTRLFVTLLPLLGLMVGSCKTSQMTLALTTNADQATFRTALFPDRKDIHDVNYRPAAGYISRAQDFVVHKPQTLMMLSQAEISYLFGKPTLHRRDADAEIWQYKVSSCVADFYFYHEETQAKLAYVDIRTRDELIPGSTPRSTPVSSREQSKCFADVIEEDFSI